MKNVNLIFSFQGVLAAVMNTFTFIYRGDSYTDDLRGICKYIWILNRDKSVCKWGVWEAPPVLAPPQRIWAGSVHIRRPLAAPEAGEPPFWPRWSRPSSSARGSASPQPPSGSPPAPFPAWEMRGKKWDEAGRVWNISLAWRLIIFVYVHCLIWYISFSYRLCRSKRLCSACCRLSRSLIIWEMCTLLDLFCT